ncbi:MotA/TolQ/ExbB proton channel family protein [Planctomycetota bacterium]
MNTWLSAIIGAVVTLAFYGIVILTKDSSVSKMFLRTEVTYFIVFLSAWSLSILFLKWRKLAFQRRSLSYRIIPSEHDFVLCAATVDDVMDNIYNLVDDPKYFVLYNRIVIALSNLRNLGRVTDVDEILRSQSEHDESSIETSYALLRGFVWAIPVLGFIGTVLGLSTAIGGFGAVLQTADDFSVIKTELVNVTGGLSTAFETTLQALVSALVIQLILAFQKKSEEEFLDSCAEYCIRHVVNRLRIMPYEKTVED